MSNTFYSKGKLLLTGEYFVLEGARALAVPLKLGQQLLVRKYNKSKPEICWKSYIRNKLWFTATFGLNNLEVADTTDLGIAEYLQKLLLFIQKTRGVFTLGQSVKIKTYLEFLPEWGFGSSSSLISNLAYWADINPYEMSFSISKSSGYDIACARSESPVLYQLRQNEPWIQDITFLPDFLNQIYFIYTGKKQDSLASIRKYREKIQKRKKETKMISELTHLVIQAKTLPEFEYYIHEHELIISLSINEPMIKSEYFMNFDGTIKSLGAWGGDFIMATHKGNPGYVKRYFNNRGLDVIFPYKKLVL